MLFKIDHGFHSVTSSDPNNFFAVFVYGFGLQPQTGTGNPTGYGYLGGYKYGECLTCNLAYYISTIGRIGMQLHLMHVFQFIFQNTFQCIIFIKQINTI